MASEIASSNISTGNVERYSSGTKNGMSFEYKGDIYKDEKGQYTDESILEGIVHMAQSGMAQPVNFKGSGAYPIMAGWDVKKSCIYLESHAYPEYIPKLCGKCAKAVRKAINYGNLMTPDNPMFAWRYIDYLPTIGFNIVAECSEQAALEYTAIPGDICCYQKGGNPSMPGHICMYSGSCWCSDFRQRSPIVYHNNVSTAYFLRYSKIIGYDTALLNIEGIGNLMPSPISNPLAKETNNPGGFTVNSYRKMYGQTGANGSWIRFRNIIYGVRAFFSYSDRTHNSVRGMLNAFGIRDKALQDNVAEYLSYDIDSFLPDVSNKNSQFYWELCKICLKQKSGYVPDDAVLTDAWNMFLSTKDIL